MTRKKKKRSFRYIYVIHFQRVFFGGAFLRKGDYYIPDTPTDCSRGGCWARWWCCRLSAEGGERRLDKITEDGMFPF